MVVKMVVNDDIKRWNLLSRKPHLLFSSLHLISFELFCQFICCLFEVIFIDTVIGLNCRGDINFAFCSYSFPIEIIGNNGFQHGIADCCKPVVSVFAMILSFSDNFNFLRPHRLWTPRDIVKMIVYYNFKFAHFLIYNRFIHSVTRKTRNLFAFFLFVHRHKPFAYSAPTPYRAGRVGRRYLSHIRITEKREHTSRFSSDCFYSTIRFVPLRRKQVQACCLRTLFYRAK